MCLLGVILVTTAPTCLTSPMLQKVSHSPANTKYGERVARQKTAIVAIVRAPSPVCWHERAAEIQVSMYAFVFTSNDKRNQVKTVSKIQFIH